MMFALFMVVVLIVTGLIWLLDIAVLRKSRAPGAADPILVEYSKSFFPVILVVFLIRSFIAEPFKIPSGSMMPTLLAGDFILVNKFTYGLRMPILNNTLVEINHPKRGDVFVFHYPPEPSIDYIKRVVGVPGDKILYQDKQLYINGQKLDMTFVEDYQYESAGFNQVHAKRFQEQLGDVKHDLLIEENSLSKEGEVTVPPGHYFAMGDNRDNSKDSRYWGFVPEQNLVGKAFFIWWNFDQFKRIGSSIN
ncbi:MAG: leader peptidase [Pseudomonadota bacterium]|jgi:signal peptidase I|nr:signal peptidase I [Candidatus Methylopumilus sp.]